MARQKKLSNSFKWSKVNLQLLSELAIIFKSNKIFCISDLACEIYKEEFDIIEKVENLLNSKNYSNAIKLVFELPENELELIELKIYHLLFVLLSCDDENSIKNVVFILEGLLSKNAGELFDFEIDILGHIGEPSILILSICQRIEYFGFSSDFIIQSCNDLESRKFMSNSKNNLIDYRNILRVVKSVINTRNSDFYSYNIKLEKRENFINHDNHLHTLEFLESSKKCDNEAEVFYFFIANKVKFDFTNAFSLLNCFQSLKNQCLKDILINEYWEILILDIDIIDMVFDVSNSIFINKLLSIRTEAVYEILSISQTRKLLDVCKTIIEIRTQKNPLEFFDTAFCSSSDKWFEFKFNCLETMLNPEQLKQYYQLRYDYFIELFDSNIETDILNYNTPLISEVVSFFTFCKKEFFEFIDKLISSYIENIKHYEHWNFDENMFFLIDEMNKRNLSLEAYKILVLMKTPLIQKVTLIKSFSRWAFFNNLSTSFKHSSLSFIRKEHRQFIILGWFISDYGSQSFDLNIDNDLPCIPSSIMNQSLFIENQLFVIERPDILKIFAAKMIEQESQPEAMRSYFPFLFSTNNK